MWCFLRAVAMNCRPTHSCPGLPPHRLKEGCARTSGKAAEVFAELLNRAAQAAQAQVQPGEQLPNITLKECRQIVYVSFLYMSMLDYDCDHLVLIHGTRPLATRAGVRTGPS